ncbi:four-carbon acid sugar kinase family protein [Oceanobacillus damuensis]|uniref:four-carbon acid sugar kinase family protein n=1 Tax=Oceanobacillus damuensis TaxID=937928 RepID=UPI00082C9231|nr:four-carbon acid sugar kinase family protein [Oceanobacillus damuensis]
MEKIIGIIADDLTGANDSGVQLTEKGINTSVLFDIPKMQDHLDNGIVIDTNSRALPRNEAASVTRQAALFLKESGYRHIYKKMDSTLRGHIGLELQAVKEVFNPEFVFVAPAFPALGRTTKDGIHFVNGKKIALTEVSKDPKHPVTESYIPALIENATGEPVGLLKKHDFEVESTVFQEKIKAFKESDITYIVCDAVDQEDLQNAARQMASFSEKVIWAGSAGLAEVLPEVLDISQKAENRSFSDSAQIMTVCGSLSEVTQGQVQFASEQSGVTGVQLDTLEIFNDNWKIFREEYIKSCLIGLEEGRDIVLYVPSNEQIRKQVRERGSELGLTSNQVGERVSQAIGGIVTEITKRNDGLSGLVLTGGDTAKDTARFLGGIGIRLVKQIEAGIPLGALIGTSRAYTVVTKAGAFGKENSIYKAMQELKGVHK